MTLLRLVLMAALAFGFTQPTLAADAREEAKELVYRVNLGRADDVKLLLDGGLSPDLTDEKSTPLISLASARTDAEGLNVLKTLLAAGANVNKQDAEGQNPLFYAARKGNKKAVQLLLEHKINYYAVDANGDIARTIAFREGHPEIITLMDDFVKMESEKISEQYRELSKNLQAQYEAVEQAQYKTAEEAAEAKRKVEAEIAAKRASSGFDTAQYEVIRAACSFQYWSYCKNQRQTSELKGSALDEAIDAQQKKTLDLATAMQTDYVLPVEYTDELIRQSKEAIFNELDAMPSRTYRFEHGVCKIADMEKRCEDVAKRRK